MSNVKKGRHTVPSPPRKSAVFLMMSVRQHVKTVTHRQPLVSAAGSVGVGGQRGLVAAVAGIGGVKTPGQTGGQVFEFSSDSGGAV